jgi:hypothetical protein
MERAWRFCGNQSARRTETTGCLMRVGDITGTARHLVGAGVDADTRASLYTDQLLLTEGHLDSVLHDADGVLDLLSSLSSSFRSVEAQTVSFKAQCDHLLTEQTRLEGLAAEVGTNLRYYSYLDNVSRRLNAPGAGRLVDHDEFGDVLENLESCIAFMAKHVGEPGPGPGPGPTTNQAHTAIISRCRVVSGPIPIPPHQGIAPSRGRLLGQA